MIEISIIGNGNHSKRIQKILKKRNYNFYIYKPTHNKLIDKINFEKVKKSEIIFICSPNDTHYKYLKILEKKYIFCEKPPVANSYQLKQLKKISHKKIYFNFNKRFSKISNVLSFRSKYNLGDLVYGSLITSHGLAQKKEYKNSWRSNILKAKTGVFEIVSIHDIDLINLHFKINKKSKPTLSNLSGVGNSFDTSIITLKVRNSVNINIFSTYMSSLSEEWTLMFKNGIIKLNDDIIKILGPTKNFDKKGFFIKPNLIKKIKVNKNDYDKTLEDSVDYFMNICSNKKFFPKKLFISSIESNSMLFN